MDFQNRVGSKTGGGGVAGWSESNRDRKERLKKLAMETIDLNKVPPRLLGVRCFFQTFELCPSIFHYFSMSPFPSR